MEAERGQPSVLQHYSQSHSAGIVNSRAKLPLGRESMASFGVVHGYAERIASFNPVEVVGVVGVLQQAVEGQRGGGRCSYGQCLRSPGLSTLAASGME